MGLVYLPTFQTIFIQFCRFSWSTRQPWIAFGAHGWLDGGNSNIFYVHPKNLGKLFTPFWVRSYFSGGLVQPPTSWDWFFFGWSNFMATSLVMPVPPTHCTGGPKPSRWSFHWLSDSARGVFFFKRHVVRMGKTPFWHWGFKKHTLNTQKHRKKRLFFWKKIWKQCGNCWISFEEAGLKLKNVEDFLSLRYQKTCVFLVPLKMKRNSTPMKIPSFNTIFQTNRENHGDFTVPSLLFYKGFCRQLQPGCFPKFVAWNFGGKTPCFQRWWSPRKCDQTRISYK